MSRTVRILCIWLKVKTKQGKRFFLCGFVYYISHPKAEEVLVKCLPLPLCVKNRLVMYNNCWFYDRWHVKSRHLTQCFIYNLHTIGPTPFSCLKLMNYVDELRFAPRRQRKVILWTHMPLDIMPVSVWGIIEISCSILR